MILRLGLVFLFLALACLAASFVIPVPTKGWVLLFMIAFFAVSVGFFVFQVDKAPF
jgi:drug/metabolite transporter (DMT)-like permease